MQAHILDIQLIKEKKVTNRCTIIKWNQRDNNQTGGIYKCDIFNGTCISDGIDTKGDENNNQETLNEVVIECVSFTGVDINTASVSLLSHVAGLTIKKAENIINYRIKNGAIKSREEFQKVKSIGEKTFTQCAGFLRIEPRSAGTMKYNILDSTWVHPESYDLAKRIISDCNLSTKDIGTPDFIRAIKSHCSDSSILKIAQKTNHSNEKGEMEMACYSHLLSPLLALAENKIAVVIDCGYCLCSLSETNTENIT